MLYGWEGRELLLLVNVFFVFDLFFLFVFFSLNVYLKVYFLFLTPKNTPKCIFRSLLSSNIDFHKKYFV